MSAEKFIDGYLKGDILLENVFLEEGSTEPKVNLGPLRAAVKAVGSIRNSNNVKQISGKTRAIKAATTKTIQDIDSLAYNGKKKTPLPTPNKPIDNEKSGDTYLRTYFNYTKNRVSGVEWRDLARSYINSKTVVRNVLVSAGILSAGSLVGAGIGSYREDRVSGAVAGGAIVSILALIIVVLSVVNGVQKSSDISDDGNPVINYQQAWRNVIEGFKNIFSGRKTDPQAGALIKVTSIIVPLSMFFAFTFELVWKQLFSGAGDMIGKGLFYVGNIVTRVGGRLWDYFRKRELVIALFGEPGSVADRAVSQQTKDKISGWWGKVGQGDLSSVENSQKLASDISEKFGRMIAYIVFPVISLAIVLFLFSELLDRFQIKKLEKMQEEEVEQQADDIL